MRMRSPTRRTLPYHVADAEVARHSADIDWVALVLEAGIAGDDEQFGEARQLGDDIVYDAIGEILLLTVVTKIREGQNSNRRAVGERQGWREKFYARASGTCLRSCHRRDIPCRNRHVEQIAAARHCLD